MTFDYDSFVKLIKDYLDSATLKITSLEDEKVTSESEIASLQKEIAYLNSENEKLKIELTKLNNLQSYPMIGACPSGAGGSGLSAAESVITKYGANAAIRQFFPKGFTAYPNAPKNASIVHTSYKPNIYDVISGNLDDEIIVLAENTREGDILEIWHEANAQVKKNTFRLADVVKAKNIFYDLVKTTNPGVFVASTYTGWMFNPKSNEDPYDWSTVKADLIGIDLDGVHVTTTPYPDWSNEVVAIKEFVANLGYTGWIVPELGVPITSDDKYGLLRAEWARNYVKLCKDAVYVAWFDYNTSPNNELITDTELAVWRTLVNLT